MRKYQQFSQGRLKTRIPTIVVMCVALFSILYFGPSLSAGVANFFVPNVPVTDAVSVSATSASKVNTTGTDEL